MFAADTVLENPEAAKAPDMAEINIPFAGFYDSQHDREIDRALEFAFAPCINHHP